MQRKKTGPVESSHNTVICIKLSPVRLHQEIDTELLLLLSFKS